MTDPHRGPYPYRSLRELAGLSLREMSRRTGIGPGRLSVVERGLPATHDEHAALTLHIERALAAQRKGVPNAGSPD